MQKDNFQVQPFPDLTTFCSSNKARPLNICIASEEILGPVRNGGIASTYYHLAIGLAEQGHNVTVMLLKGNRVQQESPEYWQQHYASKGVTLKYLEWPSEPFEHASHPWQGRCLSFYQWLKTQNFDLVHTSEWRGGAYYALMAKRLGLAFENTLFVVKASSPHIWNRHYQMQSIDHHNLYSVMHLEQKCIEWADMVVGGSAHLLRFMESVGYKLPDKRVFVQPNIVDFSFLDIKDKRNSDTDTSNIVFFGRLETRKGLELFCDAMDKCIEAGKAPTSITFLGKEGVLAHASQLSPISYIEQRAKCWPSPIQIITDKGQPEAINFLCSDNYIAVMPSLIENSTMTVYEALVFDIPFLATDVGGTSELVATSSHSNSLVKPEVDALTHQLKRIISSGQPRAIPAFDNQENIETWYQFHNYLCDAGNLASLKKTLSLTPPPQSDDQTIACIVNLSETPSEEAISHYSQLTQFEQVILVSHAEINESQLSRLGTNPNLKIEKAEGRTFGAVLNSLISRSDEALFVVSNYSNTFFETDCASSIKRALGASENICTSFFRFYDKDACNPPPKLSIPLGGDVGHQVIDNRVYGREIIFFSKAIYESVGPFDEYNIAHGILHAYVTQAIMLHELDLMVVPEVLYSVETSLDALNMQSTSYTYSKVKSAIECLPLSLRKCLMFMTNEKASAALRDIDIYTPERKGNTP